MKILNAPPCPQKSPAGAPCSADALTFSSSTSLHGVARAVSAPSRAQRAFWITVVVAGVAMAGWQVALRLAAYYAWPTSTSLTLHYVRDPAFPAVTVCNYNRSLKGTWDVLAALSILSAGMGEWPESVADEVRRFWNENLNFSTRAFTLKHGFQLNSASLLECKFNSKPCGIQDFQHVFTEYGNCYTFNGGFAETRHRSLKQKTAGAGKGLQILLDVQQWDYLDNWEIGLSGVGIRLVVHDPEEPPQVEALGLSVGVGTQAYVAVQQIKMMNQKYPWGECDPSKKLLTSAPYSMAGCLQECEAALVERMCGCKPFHFPGDITECSLYHQYHCARDALALSQAQGMCTGGSYSSKCPVPCLHKSFPSSVSYATFPSLQATHRYGRSHNLTLGYMRENMLFIDVAYKDLNYALIQQQKTLPESVLLSDIGGQLGLFVGASMITIIEVLAFTARGATKAFNVAASFLRTRAATCVEATLSPPVPHVHG